MYEFFTGAMPWIVIGLCVVLGISLHLRRKADQRRHPEHRQQGQETRINEGACIGMCAGVAIASAAGINYGLAMGAGTMIGALIGSRIQKK